MLVIVFVVAFTVDVTVVVGPVSVTVVVGSLTDFVETDVAVVVAVRVTVCVDVTRVIGDSMTLHVLLPESIILGTHAE